MAYEVNTSNMEATSKEENLIVPPNEDDGPANTSKLDDASAFEDNALVEKNVKSPAERSVQVEASGLSVEKAVEDGEKVAAPTVDQIPGTEDEMKKEGDQMTDQGKKQRSLKLILQSVVGKMMQRMKNLIKSFK